MTRACSFVIRSQKLALIVIGVALSFRAEAAALVAREIQDSSAILRIGTQSYSKTDGGDIKVQGSGQMFNYEYSRYLRMNQALVIGFRQTTDPLTKRDASHHAYAGYRFFPMGVGIPMLAVTEDSNLLMDARFKPYAEGSLGLGHTFLKRIDANSAGEFANNTMAIAFGGGLMMHFFSRWMVDLQIMYETVQSRGGTAGALNVGGSNLSILLGNGLLF